MMMSLYMLSKLSDSISIFGGCRFRLGPMSCLYSVPFTRNLIESKHLIISTNPFVVFSILLFSVLNKISYSSLKN